MEETITAKSALQLAGWKLVKGNYSDNITWKKDAKDAYFAISTFGLTNLVVSNRDGIVSVLPLDKIEKCMEVAHALSKLFGGWE